MSPQTGVSSARFEWLVRSMPQLSLVRGCLTQLRAQGWSGEPLEVLWFVLDAAPCCVGCKHLRLPDDLQEGGSGVGVSDLHFPSSSTEPGQVIPEQRRNTRTLAHWPVRTLTSRSLCGCPSLALPTCLLAQIASRPAVNHSFPHQWLGSASAVTCALESFLGALPCPCTDR